MSTSHSNKPCTVHTWMSTTADGWRFCPRCHQALHLVHGEWIAVPSQTPTAPRTTRTRTRQTVLEERKTPKGKHIKEGFYIDHSRAENHIQAYWGA
jgi:hypothetical protein